MKVFLKLIIILLAIGLGIYLGGFTASFLLDHKHVYLGNPSGNLLIPAFYLLMTLIGGAVFGSVIGLFFILKARKKLKSPYK